MSSPTVFSDFQPNSAAGFLQGANSRNFNKALGYLKDGIVEILIQGIKQRFVLESSPDAMGYHGEERLVPRFDGDTDALYAQRVSGAWEQHQLDATPTGLIDLLASAGFNSVEIYERQGSDPEWFKFSVFIFDPRFGESPKWGDFNWDDGAYWGFRIVPSNAESIIPIVRLMKPSHTICEEIRIIRDQVWAWGDGTLWGDGSSWGGDFVVLAEDVR
jgi:hypothetical protein